MPAACLEMGFLRVNINNDVMCISKSPGIKSLSFFIGILSLGLGAAYYGSDNLLLKCSYVLGCFIIASTFIEDWEVCILDKTNRKVTFSKRSIYQKLLYFKKCKELDIHLSSVISVRTEAKKLPNTSSKYNISLVLGSGMSLPIVDTHLSSNKSNCDLLAERIRRFLKLSHMESVDSADLDDSSFFSDHESSSSDSDLPVTANSGLPRESVTLINERR